MGCLREIFLATAIVAGVVAGTGPVAGQGDPIRIAVVDMDRVVGQSTRGQALQSRLEALEREARGELERLNGEAEELRRQMSEGSATLPDAALSDLQKRYEDTTIELRRRKEDAERRGQKMQDEELKIIQRELESVLVKLREEDGYDLLLNNVPGVVVMVTKRIDITDKVLARLNEVEAAGGG